MATKRSTSKRTSKRTKATNGRIDLQSIKAAVREVKDPPTMTTMIRGTFGADGTFSEDEDGADLMVGIRSYFGEDGIRFTTITKTKGGIINNGDAGDPESRAGLAVNVKVPSPWSGRTTEPKSLKVKGDGPEADYIAGIDEGDQIVLGFTTYVSKGHGFVALVDEDEDEADVTEAVPARKRGAKSLTKGLDEDQRTKLAKLVAAGFDLDEALALVQ